MTLFDPSTLFYNPNDLLVYYVESRLVHQQKIAWLLYSSKKKKNYYFNNNNAIQCVLGGGTYLVSHESIPKVKKKIA